MSFNGFIERYYSMNSPPLKENSISPRTSVNYSSPWELKYHSSIFKKENMKHFKCFRGINI